MSTSYLGQTLSPASVLISEVYSCKVFSINFEPSEIACQVHPISRGAWIISILAIHTEQIYLGLELDNLMNTLKPLTSDLQSCSLFMKSQPNVNRVGPKRFNSQREIVQTIYMTHHNRWHFAIKIFAIYASLIVQLQSNLINRTNKPSFLSVQHSF